MTHCICMWGGPGPCPCPYNPAYPGNWGRQTMLPPAPVIYPEGCICPPTSEKTCENPSCPRKAKE